MRPYPITAAQADAAFSILVQHAGVRDDERGWSRESFIVGVATGQRPTDEYRFMGSLGFGGKFRNNGNRSTPYVDCYPEHETPDRLLVIERTNAALATLFGVPVERAGGQDG